VYGLIEAYIYIYIMLKKRKTQATVKWRSTTRYCEEAGYGTCGLYEIVCGI
jgi:hypothetical protein